MEIGDSPLDAAPPPKKARDGLDQGYQDAVRFARDGYKDVAPGVEASGRLSTPRSARAPRGASRRPECRPL